MAICKIVKGGVCSAKGFRAAGVAAEIKYNGPIIRPAYKSIFHPRDYVKLTDR